MEVGGSWKLKMEPVVRSPPRLLFEQMNRKVTARGKCDHESLIEPTPVNFSSEREEQSNSKGSILLAEIVSTELSSPRAPISTKFEVLMLTTSKGSSFKKASPIPSPCPQMFYSICRPLYLILSSTNRNGIYELKRDLTPKLLHVGTV
jgi:hypothetical protein